jgi:hypothetical protein
VTRQFEVTLTPLRAGAMVLGALAFGLVTGYGMAGRGSAAVEAAAPDQAVVPAGMGVSPTVSGGGGGTVAKAHGPGAPGVRVKRFKKGSSCS